MSGWRPMKNSASAITTSARAPSASLVFWAASSRASPALNALR
jgi:hypothetical protein